MSDWPPEGYGDPQEWEKSETGIALMITVITIPLAYLFRREFTVFVEPVRQLYVSLVSMLGLSQSLLGSLLVLGLCLLLVAGSLYVGFGKVVIPIHERIHYEIDELLEMNPEYTSDYALFQENPAVIPMSTGISLTKNTASALGPIVIIGIVAGGLTLLTEGIVSGVFAFIFVTNTACSCGDLYNVYRFIRMPSGTLFANFKEGDDHYRTEYVFPEAC